jgi:hypothetical protein
MEVKAGTRLRSTACSTEVIVVRAVDGVVDLRCGGRPMVAIDEPGGGGPLDPVYSDGTQLGKRYVSADESLEVLCTKAGDGSLSIGSEPLARKDAKPLPSSD